MKKLTLSIIGAAVALSAPALAANDPPLSQDGEQFAVIHQEQDCQTGWATAYDKNKALQNAQAEIAQLKQTVAMLTKELQKPASPAAATPRH